MTEGTMRWFGFCAAVILYLAAVGIFAKFSQDASMETLGKGLVFFAAATLVHRISTMPFMFELEE